MHNKWELSETSWFDVFTDKTESIPTTLTAKQLRGAVVMVSMFIGPYPPLMLMVSLPGSLRDCVDGLRESKGNGFVTFRNIPAVCQCHRTSRCSGLVRPGNFHSKTGTPGRGGGQTNQSSRLRRFANPCFKTSRLKSRDGPPGWENRNSNRSVTEI